jgi:hypothetical protein
MTYADDLIEAMREELQQYGEMLARLELKVRPGARDATEAVRVGMITLEDQSVVLDTTTRRRKEVQRRLARALGLAEDAGLSDIMPFLPSQYKLLVGALRDENQDLALRVQGFAHRKRELSHYCLQTGVESSSQRTAPNHA